MVTLAKWEVEELQEALRARPRRWQEVSPTRWIRHSHDQKINYFELRLQNGLPYGMYSISVTDVDVNVEELVRALTSYGDRKKIEDLLSIRLCGWDEGGPDDIQELSLNICRIMVGAGVEPVKDESTTTRAVQSSTGEIPVSDLPEVIVAKRSRYLENLLKGRK